MHNIEVQKILTIPIFFFPLKLPPTDATPAYEVNLTTAVSLQSSTAVASRHIERQSSNPALTEINLNLNSTQVSSSTSSTGPVSTNQCVSVDNILPPVNELPSYNEAIRLKKLEAYTNELPPGYFDPADTELRHGPETVNVNRYIIHYFIIIMEKINFQISSFLKVEIFHRKRQCRSTGSLPRHRQ